MDHQENQQPKGVEVSQQAPDSLLQGVLNRLEQRHVYLTAGMPAQDLIDALDHPQWDIRAAAVRALSALEGQAPIDALLTALRDEHRLVRAAAVRALGHLGLRMPAEQLILALQDPAWEVREMAVLVLLQYPQNGSRKEGYSTVSPPASQQGTLYQENPKKSVGSAPSELGEQISNPLRSLLLAALHDSNSNVRDAAAYALNQYDAAHTPPALTIPTREQTQAGPSLPTQQTSLRHVLLSSIARIGRVFSKQVPLIHKSVWAVTPLLMLFWYVTIIIAKGNPSTASLYLALITTISTAAGTAFLYGGENDAGFELTLSTPTSLRGILFYRFLLIVGYNVLLTACASALVAFSHGGSLWEIVSLWLGPMLLLSSFTLTLSMLIGSWFALTTACIIELSQSFIITSNNQWPMLELSLSTSWQTNPTILCLAVLLIVLAVLYAPRQPRLSQL